MIGFDYKIKKKLLNYEMMQKLLFLKNLGKHVLFDRDRDGIPVESYQRKNLPIFNLIMYGGSNWY